MKNENPVCPFCKGEIQNLQYDFLDRHVCGACHRTWDAREGEDMKDIKETIYWVILFVLDVEPDDSSDDALDMWTGDDYRDLVKLLGFSPDEVRLEVVRNLDYFGSNELVDLVVALRKPHALA